MIFVEGAPRSGTTLLISMLATHPEIAATVAESHLFDRGVGELFDNHARNARYEGFLSNYVSGEELTDLVRDLCDGVLGTMRDRVKPGAPYVAEKTPAPRYDALTLMKRKLAVYPDAIYVHVVRERDAVVRSLLRAPWADCDEPGAADWWRQSVEAVRETAGASESARYVELAYEDLAADPVAALIALFGQLGLETSGEVRARLEAASRERISSFGPQGASDASSTAASTAPVGGGRGQGGPAESAASPLRTRAADLVRRFDGRRGRDASLAQDLMVAARGGDAAGVVALTHPSFAFELRSGAGDLAASGDDGRKALLSVAAELFRAQAVSESWSGVSEGETTVLLLAATYGDGTRTDVAAMAFVRDGLIERFAVLAAGEPGGRVPAAWEPGAP